MAASMAGSCAFVTGCGGAPVVVRVYDGRVVEGRYVSPPAYAAFLKGVLAEEDGDLASARSAFEAVVDVDADDPLAWARLGAVRCRQGGADGRSDAARAFAKARAADATYAGALGAEAACGLASGDVAGAFAASSAARAADPANVELAALSVRIDARRPRTEDAEVRSRAVALTRESGEREASWDALIAWSHAHGDEELLVRGLAGLVALAPQRLAEIERHALGLAARDRLPSARAVAAAIADAPRDRGHRGPRDVVVARLAVDEAILRGDPEALRRRAARGHVLLVEAAARAVAQGKLDLGAAVARELAAADPGALGPALVLAASAPGALALPEAAPGTHDTPPALCAYVLAVRIEGTSGPEAARAWLARTAYVPPPPGDALVAGLGARLAKRGALPPPPA
jgi:hypothetical protein